MMIIGGSSDIDEEYAKDFYLPMDQLEQHEVNEHRLNTQTIIKTE
jgi:hypothetical protein